MKYRDYKESGPGEYFHIFNRGNEKTNIFLDKDDFSFFLLRLRQNLQPSDKEKKICRNRFLPQGSFSLVCYCLMPNHFHLLLRQNRDLRTGTLLSRICTSYASYFNKKYQRIGHLFQDKFKQVIIDNNEYLVWVSAYIHQNPKVAGIVKTPEDYPWSSYPGFIGTDKNFLCDNKVILDQFGDRKEYKKFVDSSHNTIKDKKEVEELLLD